MKTPASIAAQLRERNREIALLHAISRVTNDTVGLPDLLKNLCRLIVSEMKADSALIYLLDDSGDQLVLRGSSENRSGLSGDVCLGVGEGITGWVAQKMKPVALTRQAFKDPRFKVFETLPQDRYEAFLSVPILQGKSLIGVLNIQHKKAHRHSDSEKKLADVIAVEIAGAIRHAQAVERAQKRSEQIGALARMSQSITQGVYLREILQLIVTMTAEMMGSKICSLMLLDEKGQELRIEATQSLSQEYRSKPPIRVGESVSGRALQERKPISVIDVTQDPHYAYPDLARRENLRSLLVVPMMAKDKPIGVLNCYTSQPHVFTAEEIQLVQAVANQAAIAIEHTRTMEQAMEAQEALESRKVIERAKGILMRQQHLSEESAFRLIQRQAMDRRKTMKEVSEAIILSEEIQRAKS